MENKKLVKLVKDILDANDSSEEERHEMFLILEKNVPHPEPTNLIFHHKPKLTAEEVVEKALSYKPIIMPPPSKKD
jgi:hypothetical protein